MIGLLIADDHPIVREGLKRIVADCEDIEVVGEAGDAAQVLEVCAATKVDVLLLDINMPGPGVFEILRQLSEEYPGTRVIVLSVHPEKHYALRTLRAGAAGYLNKDQSPKLLETAIRQAWRKGRYLSPALAEKLAFELVPSGEVLPHTALSDREFEVLRMLCADQTTKEIACQLELSPKTVSTYRTRILQKMDLKGTAELVRYALEHGLVD